MLCKGFTICKDVWIHTIVLLLIVEQVARLINAIKCYKQTLLIEPGNNFDLKNWMKH